MRERKAITRPTADACLTLDEVSRAIAFVNTNLGRKVTVADVARELDVDENYFPSMIKEALGMSLQQWIIRQRCWDAAARLVGSDERLPDIAERLGFYSLTHFTGTFGKHMGITPGAYRRNVAKYEQAKAALQPFQS